MLKFTATLLSQINLNEKIIFSVKCSALEIVLTGHMVCKIGREQDSTKNWQKATGN